MLHYSQLSVWLGLLTVSKYTSLHLISFPVTKIGVNNQNTCLNLHPFLHHLSPSSLLSHDLSLSLSFTSQTYLHTHILVNVSKIHVEVIFHWFLYMLVHVYPYMIVILVLHQILLSLLVYNCFVDEQFIIPVYSLPFLYIFRCLGKT